MSLKYGFYNSVNGDRVYDARDFSSIFDGVITDGVYEKFGDAFEVIPGSGLSVEVGTGRAWFNNTWSYNDSSMTIELDAASSAGARYDAILLVVDTSDEIRANEFVVISGAVAANPSKPTWTNTDTKHHYPIAYVKILQSATTISSSNIEMVVGTTACPYAKNVLGSDITFDVLDVEHGGTGNDKGYIQTGKKSGTTVGTKSTAEGEDTTASGYYCHAEGNGTKATGYWTHAEGKNTAATMQGDHAEGQDTTASGTNSHAEGRDTTASGTASHAEGNGTEASGYHAHAEGYDTTASGDYSHAEGEHTSALGEKSHSAGITTTANYCQTVVGIGSLSKGNTGSYQSDSGYFIVGCGSPSYASSASRANCLRATEQHTYGRTYDTAGADYAEMFEWLDENPYEEDRIALFVTLDGDKIRLATANDDYILGVTSAHPAVIGDEADEWHAMYESDIYGRHSYEKVWVPPVKDDSGQVIKEGHYDDVLKLSDEYDPEQEYIHRKYRPEWAAVGLIGKLALIDDGTAEVNGYVYPSMNGIATKASNKTRYRVMKRLDSTHIQIMVL